jgi:CelD/BcsL family acetyltransferase involved in cellulose biosynthesis
MQRAAQDLDNAFLSPEFALAAGRVRPRTRVAVLEDGGGPAGFLAYEQGRLRVGRPVAAGVSDAQAVVHVAGFEWSARELLDGCGLDVLEFDHLVGSQLARARGAGTARPSWVMDVSRGYEAYLDERLSTSKKIFKSTLYKQRKLGRDLGGTRFEFDSRDAAALDVLMRWKSAQYRRTGRRDRFAVGWIERLVHDLFSSAEGTLSVLYGDPDRVVAAHFGLRTATTLSCWFPAYDVELGRYSPGLALHLEMARAAAAAGVRRLDLGKGDEPYKQSLKTGAVDVGEASIERRSVAALGRRAQRTPRRLAEELIASRPALRQAARSLLAGAGRLRGAR